MIRRILSGRLREERGIALALSLGTLTVLTVVVTAGLYTATSNTRSAELGKNQQLAFALAEAGVNNAMSILANPTNNALNSTLLPPRTNEYETGSVEWSGTLDEIMFVWKVVSTGRVRNPNTSGFTTRRLVARIPVYPTYSQPLNNPAWNYIYSRGTGQTCDMTIGQSVNVTSPLYVQGNLCLQNTSKISSGPLVVHGGLTMSQTENQVGAAGAPIVEARIKNGCKWKNNPLHNPCWAGAGSAGNDNIWATVLDNAPPTVDLPQPLWDDWYANAMPGPSYPCTTSTGTVPVFENETTSPTRNNSVPTVFHLTPATSYSCATAGGQITWDAGTRVLTMQGTIFIDGSVKVENGLTNSYEGHATLYLSGTVLMKNSKLCAMVSGSGCTTENWNPNAKLLVIVANGSGGQVPADTGAQFVSAHFQGAVWATRAIDISTTSLVEGPLNGGPVRLGQSSGSTFPGFTIVPVGMPGNPAVYAQPGTPSYGDD